ncbi:hypothetical protein JVU11DRAFT_5883 [Chiua virens]|nr:hypothetical protein JVU11DRAFT_5883 [Chiua virens]
MDQMQHQDHSQKDFLAFLFPESSSPDHTRQQDSDVPHRIPNNLSNFTGSNNSSFNQQPLDLMAMSNLISLQGLDSSSTTLPSPTALTPQMLLEQQYKLTQLHQLQQLQNQIQNQIFQQQLALISGQTSLATPETSPDPPCDPVPPFNGLPTPLSSAEIRPTNPDFMSRLNPSFQNAQHSVYNSHALDSMPLPSPQEPSAASQYMRHPGSASAPANIAFQSFPSPSDLDISPLTSPWLEAYPHPPNNRPAKRTVSPSGDDTARVPRKRPTPTAPVSIKAPRNVKSATSTPLLRSARGRRNSSVNETDSPSPVDLAMPPPAPPRNPSLSPSTVNTTVLAPPPQEEVRMTPVTPASIMNLGRLGVSSSLAPMTQLSRVDKGKESTKTKDTASKASRKAGLPLISPGPKPIPSRYAHLHVHPLTVSPPAPITRKSHKDAEQKRRDSLKTAYDDLRMLLPPIPLPRAVTGPNKGVSKLQLLRCGNDYLRTLKSRVDRRDSEIATLRHEVLRLRVFAGDEANKGDVDLDHDLDAVEALGPRMGLSVLDEEGDDGDE